MEVQTPETSRSVTVRLANDVRHRLTPVVTVYASFDAPEWSGAVDQGADETDAEHADRSAVLKQLFGRD